nr:hypothetical protein RP007_04323 [Rhizobium sp. P007]
MSSLPSRARRSSAARCVHLLSIRSSLCPLTLLTSITFNRRSNKRLTPSWRRSWKRNSFMPASANNLRHACSSVPARIGNIGDRSTPGCSFHAINVSNARCDKGTSRPEPFLVRASESTRRLCEKCVHINPRSSPRRIPVSIATINNVHKKGIFPMSQASSSRCSSPGARRWLLSYHRTTHHLCHVLCER